eukprot:8705106-Prorocentrum_lima.AAC.1
MEDGGNKLRALTVARKIADVGKKKRHVVCDDQLLESIRQGRPAAIPTRSSRSRASGHIMRWQVPE